MRFKEFLLNENRAYLGQKIGDILNAVQDLQSDGANMGSRQITKFSEKVVAQIRRILHSNWPESEDKHLKKLQKVAVAMMKTIEDQGDIKELIPNVAQELQQLSSELGTPVNVLGAPEDAQLPEAPPPGEPAPEPQPGAEGQPPPGPEGAMPPMPGAEGQPPPGGMPPMPAAPGQPPPGGMPMPPMPM
jgi:hypothetical protein